jgi:cytochrome c-type biogenesis protein CcmH
MAITLAAEPAIFSFDDPAEEARFQQLTGELRCLVCQNQSLADSHADLAGDLREEVYNFIRAGKSDQEIIDFLVQRYGDFVLYRPRVDFKTYALWFGPVALFLVAALLLIRTLRRRRHLPVQDLSPEERARVAELLEPSDTPGHPPQENAHHAERP